MIKKEVESKKVSKGIILAGGKGTRLHPMTLAISKHLLPIYDKPLIYYPLSTLMLAGIREILIITTPHDQALFKELLKDGSHWGINLSYAAQSYPAGLAHAFILAEDFIGNDSVCLILGDNIFYGHGLNQTLQLAANTLDGATVFGYYVKDPNRYGVIEFNDNGSILSIVEKPITPKSNFAVTGIYFYDNNVIEYAKHLKPSARGELEITDINNRYLQDNCLNLKLFERGIAWLDTGTPESLLQAAHFIEVIQERQDIIISSPEEIAWRMNYISTTQLQKLAEQFDANNYGKHLLKLSQNELNYEYC